MSKGLFAISIVLGLASCTSSKPLIGPSGRVNYLVRCSTVRYCYEKAADICRRPYTIVDKTVEQRNMNTNGNMSTTDTSLLIECSSVPVNQGS